MPAVPAIIDSGDVTVSTSGTTLIGYDASGNPCHDEALLVVVNRGLQPVTIAVSYSIDGTNSIARDYGAEQSINGDAGLLAGETRSASIPWKRGAYIQVTATVPTGTGTAQAQVVRPPRFRSYPQIGP